MLECKISSFPINYLGLPLHDRKLRVQDWDIGVDKIAKKLPNWSGTLLSSGGRYTLVNSVLTAVPLYMLSLYKLLVIVEKKIDRIRCRFFWQGTSNHRKKSSLVAWKRLCQKFMEE